MKNLKEQMLSVCPRVLSTIIGMSGEEMAGKARVHLQEHRPAVWGATLERGSGGRWDKRGTLRVSAASLWVEGPAR